MKINRVEFDSIKMYVYLEDRGVITVHMAAYPRLRDATPKQRLRFRIFGRGTGIRWDEIDEGLSVSGLVRDFGVEPDQDPAKLLRVTRQHTAS